MTLMMNYHIPLFTLLVVCIYQLSGHKLQSFLKKISFIFFSIEKQHRVYEFAFHCA